MRSNIDLTSEERPWKLLCEGQTLNIKNSEVAELLVKKKILEPCLASSLWRATTPGIFALDGQAFIVLPRLYSNSLEANSFDLASSVFLNIKALDRFAKEQARHSIGNLDNELFTISHGEPQSLFGYLEAALLLWQDFEKNGRLTLVSRTKSTVKPGRIVWPKTLREGRPVFANTGTVFSEIHRTSVRRDLADTFVQLHRKTCLGIGRLMGKKHAGDQTLIKWKEAFDTLGLYRNRCFTDRHRFVHGLLERYYRLRGRSSEQTKSLNALFLKRFEYLWERILQVALGHNKRKIPSLRGSYYSNNLVNENLNGHKSQGLHLKPDILTFAPYDADIFLIFDAKDYDRDQWPGTADISKQILYRFLQSGDGGNSDGPSIEKIGSAFLFPARRGGVNCPFSIRGFHELDSLEDRSLARLGRIIGLDVDYERVVQSYLSGRCDLTLLTEISKSVMSMM